MVLSLEPVTRPSVSDSDSNFAGSGQAWGRIFYYEFKDRCSDFDGKLKLTLLMAQWVEMKAVERKITLSLMIFDSECFPTNQ